MTPARGGAPGAPEVPARWGTAALAALLLCAAAPPGWFPGAGWLVLPGLAVFYALARATGRPWLSGYLVGVAYFSSFSWSLRHISYGVYASTCAAGGLYFALAVAWTRSLGRLPGSLAYGLAIAGTQWLRGVVPEIPYPHAQPAHALYHWPAVLGSVAWGGEVLANGLLAALAAVAVDLLWAWRAGTPCWRGAVRQFAVVAGLVLLGSLVPAPLPPRPAGGEPLRVLAVEPGVPPAFAHLRQLPLLQPQVRTAVTDILVRETVALAGPRQASPPALVLWPETAFPVDLVATGNHAELSRSVRLDRVLHSGTLLLAGTQGLFAGDRETPVAVLLDAGGRLLGWHEKRALVPGGEYIPFLPVLPASVAAAIEAGVQAMFHALPCYEPGHRRPLLELPSGQTVGAMLCYDNAFPWVAREEVAAGAQALFVLSNESWYERGDELAQMEAMTVFRALENRVPLVRCTVDGVTVAIGASGRTLARLPYRGVRPDAARTLSVELMPGAGRLPPVAWLQRLLGPLAALSGLLLAWRVLVSWARLARRFLPHRARTARIGPTAVP